MKKIFSFKSQETQQCHREVTTGTSIIYFLSSMNARGMMQQNGRVKMRVCGKGLIKISKCTMKVKWQDIPSDFHE